MQILSGKNLISASLIISSVSALNSILTFTLHAQILRYYGVGCIVDAFLVATSIPAAASSLYTGVLSNILLPNLQSVRSKSSNFGAQYLGTIKGFLFLSIILTVTLTFAGPRQFSDPLCNSVAEATFSAYILAIPLATLVSIFVVNRQIAGQVSAGSKAQIWPSLIQAFTITVFGSKLGIDALGWAYLGGTFVQLIFVWNCKSVKYLADYTLFKKMLTEIPLTAASLSLFVLVPLSDYYWASKMAPGSLTYIANCQRIIVGATGVLATGISTVTIANLSAMHLASTGSKTKFLNKCLMLYFAACLPVILTVRSLADVIIKILFQRGMFTETNSLEMAELLRIVIIGMLPMGMATILFKGMFAEFRVTSAALIGFLSTAFYFIVSGILSETIGILGLGMGYTGFWFIVSTICRKVLDPNTLSWKLLKTPLYYAVAAILLGWDALNAFWISKSKNAINQHPLATILSVFVVNAIISVIIYRSICRNSNKTINR